MRRLLRTLLGLAVVVAAASALVNAIMGPPPDPEEQARVAEAVSAELAWRYCQDAVRNQLKAPSTARFPGYDAVDGLMVRGQDGTVAYQITSYVDAQNSFGAMIRTKFDCVVRKLPDGRWVVGTVTFHES